MNRFADLHIHTIHSDGVLTPEQILIKAQKFRLSAISFTDHDTINAYLEIDNYKEKYKIEIITGIELSCHEDGREIHLLGYGIDIENPKLTEFIKTVKGKRIKRAERILDKLSDIGINLSMDYVQEKAGTAPITRPHIAKAIYEQGYVNTTKEAFNLYIGDYSPAYEPKADFPVSKGIELIKHCGGLAVVAHPAQNFNENTLFKLINYGLDGIETVHPLHGDFIQKYYRSIANQYWLLETGGSDYHGNRDYDDFNFGKFVVPYSAVESIHYHLGMR